MTLESLKQYLQERGVKIYNMMTEFPEDSGKHYAVPSVHIPDLLQLFENSDKVYGYKTQDPSVSRFYQKTEHLMWDCKPEIEALVIDIRPIKQKEPIEEAVELMAKTLKAMKAGGIISYKGIWPPNTYISTDELEAFLAKHGVKR